MSLLPPGIFGGGMPWGSARRSTPLADGAQSELIPRSLFWAMKYHRRHQADDGDGGFEQRLGDGDDAVYAVDDGPSHCLLGRVVGWSEEGCTYCLVGRLSIGDYERYTNDEAPWTAAFCDTRDVRLCAVYEAEDGPSNVADVRRYRRGRDVPTEYLPPHPAGELPPYL